jgi:hypothetical protein
MVYENCTMKYKGYSARIMEAERLTGDSVHGLPPGSPLSVYPMDVFVKIPGNWMKGPGVFLVPVKPNKGLWFNWTMNSAINTAVIPTVKGCNPITGLQTTGFHLEKYETKCPKHNCDFLAERFCPECNYNWPDRNYQSMSPSWWDGFRADDGTVRQFFFSEDELRDIATGLIGKENTVPAFGFAFYSPKERRPEVQATFNSTMIYPYANAWGVSETYDYSQKSLNGYLKTHDAPSAIYSCSVNNVDSSNAPVACAADPCAGGASVDSVSEEKTAGTLKMKLRSSTSDGSGGRSANLLSAAQSPRGSCDRSFSANVPVKEVSVGAGSRISQSLNVDPYSIDSWRDTPDSVMTIYFVFQEKFNEIIAGGLKDLEGSKEGMLSNCIVG